MALIIEDGSIVVNANSYATRDQIIAYALARLITLPDTDVTDGNAINAMDYLLNFDERWKGEQVSPGVQTQAWPRKCVRIGAYRLPEDQIPVGLVSAQCQLAIYSSQGVNLLPIANAEAFVKREKIGPLETEYSETIAFNNGNAPSFPAVNLLLASIINGGGSLRSVRI